MLYLIIMAEKIPVHVHCPACGKSIPVGESVCSEDCKQKYQSFITKKRIMMYIVLALMAAFTALIVVSSLKG